MTNADLNRDKIIKYWIESSDDDFDTMIAMFDSRRFSWSMFIGHLMIEKLLKALFVKTNSEYPPYIHNLLRLAEKCGLDLNEEQRLFFCNCNSF
jgi:HEPN domain-containing protein